MTRPSVAELLMASGHTEFSLSLIMEASQTLYGDVGDNLDERDWVAIMAAPNPLAAAQQAMKDQWQNREYLLRNADHLINQGHSFAAWEVTYHQMARRLELPDGGTWFYPPTIFFEFTDTTANIDVSLAGTLSFSITGTSQAVDAGDVALTPGASLSEGYVTVTRESGAATTTGDYVIVGTHDALTRNFNAGRPVMDRIVILGDGNDDVSSGGGNDTIYGGAGADTIYGNAGNDVIRTGIGADSIQAGKGNDTIFGDAGADIIYGGTEGNDELTGGIDGDDFLLADDGSWFDTITDFESSVDDISVTSSAMDGLEPLSAIGTETATTSAGATNGIEIADNDVHYVSVNGQAGALTTGGTATLTFADLTASTLTNLAAYLDERFTNAVATGTTGAVDAIIVVNWTAPSSTTSYVYEFTENAASVNISASELALLGVIERSSAILTIGDVI